MSESPYTDMRLLPALDALLQEGSVTAAAGRLHLSPAAMSRNLSKIRLAVGDPVLVRVGRGLVPTPRARELQPLVHALVREAAAILTPQRDDDPTRARTALTVASEIGYAVTLGPTLLSSARSQVPRASFRFITHKRPGSCPLHEGTVDVEVGVLDGPYPELRVEPLFQESFVGVTAEGHPLLRRPVTAEAFAAARHVSVSSTGGADSSINAMLRELGLHRQVVASVPDFLSALLLLPRTDLVATVPRTLVTHPHLPLGIETFELPVHVAPLRICQAWHPRHEADPVHLWLREAIRGVLARPFP